MSYCRFIEGDIYLYYDVYGGLTCMACSLMPVREVTGGLFDIPEDDPLFIHDNFITKDDYDLMIEHVGEHRAAGESIPDDVEDLLRDDKERYTNDRGEES